MNQIVIGMAGHIDHGKTSLVKALTGTNTDILKEELSRGMTIDIGFAFLDKTITLIDVPGHEKFVKNMMAGASGIDGAVLVVAADDGIMPQTKEHFEILNLLNIKNIIVALNKTDLADEEWIELVEMDIHELMQNAGIDNFSIQKVSTINNNGIEELKDAILQLSQNIPKRLDNGIFRLPIDRVFTIQGFGTVVTGTIQSGQLSVGDEVEIIPGNLKVKVRGIHTHQEKIEKVEIGDRAAINFQGLDKKSVKRGFQCASIGYLDSSDEFGAKISNLTNSKVEIVQNQRVRVHAGTQEVMARISILEKKVVIPGETAIAILKLEEPLVISMNDRFIIRRYSPVITIGGGIVLDTQLKGKWNEKKKYIKSIAISDEKKRIIKIIEFQEANPIDKSEINIKFGIERKILLEKLKEYPQVQFLKEKNEIWLVTNTQLEKIDNQLLHIMDDFQKLNRLKPGMLIEEVYQSIKGNNKFIDSRINALAELNKVNRNGEYWSTSNFSVKFSEKEKLVYNNIIEKLKYEGFYSSNINDFSIITGIHENDLIPLLKIGQMKGEIIRLTETLMFTKNNFNILKDSVISYIKLNGSISVGEFKNLAKTSRKYAVPLLEYFDKQKITYRDGNERKLIN